MEWAKKYPAKNSLSFKATLFAQFKYVDKLEI